MRERDKVRFEELTRRKILRSEPCRADEIQGLLASADSFLKDARRTENSLPTRFNVAYEAAHALALAALRTHDLRPGHGPGHRIFVFAELEATAGIPDATRVPLEKANEKRNRLTYDGLTTFSASELEELIESATLLRKMVESMIRKVRPELLLPAA